jgi:hypothetical protein
MVQKNLSKIIQKVAHKRLSYVECLNSSSNQHEFNGMSNLKKILGDKRLNDFPVKIIYMDDNEEKVIIEDSTLSWYDSREKHPKRSEFRLYYKHNEPMVLANENDLFIFFQTSNNSQKKYYLIISPNGSISEKQLCWLFDIQINLFDQKLISQNTNDKTIDIFVHKLLEKCDINIDISNDNYLDGLIDNFDNSFPSTIDFSNYARSMVRDFEPITESDNALVKSFEMENILFKTFEKHIVGQQLKNMSFEDVESFIIFSLSVQNRRKARAGRSFENHIKHILELNNINFSYNISTENNHKPDFLFPSIEHYHNDKFNSDELFMLAAKTTCKDRWTQVLSEANRIDKKHLITMDPAISNQQINQMKESNLQLVIPKNIQNTYDKNQIIDLISFKEFIELVNHSTQAT